MKEVTRIHIAKVSYDIEIGAKKELEKYIGNLEAYADDQELLQDIEIRITELLEARGIKQNDVIASDDVVAVREQLGEPKEFMGDGDMAVGPDVELSGEATRKLYRNVDSAVFGGVLSGIASFFRISPLWTRLIFIILLFASAGAALLVYIVLWIALPPARTAAEKLQMAGRPVTLGSIRELNEDQSGLEQQHRRAEVVRRTGVMALGIFSVFAAVGAMAVTIGAGVGFPLFQGDILMSAEWPYIVAFVLALVSGLLLATLFSIGAYAAFARRFTKRLLVSIVCVVIAGVVAFGTAIGLVGYQSWLITSQVRDNLVSTPSDFPNIKTLIAETGVGTHVEYIVDSTPHMTLRSLPEESQPTMSVKDDTATLRFVPNSRTRLSHGPVLLKVYGPKLDTLIVKNSTINMMSAGSTSFTVETLGSGSSVNLLAGAYDKVVLKAGEATSISASNASVAAADVGMKANTTVTLGTVNVLSVAQPDSCPSDQRTSLDLVAITSGAFSYNGGVRPAKTYSSHCGKVTIGVDDHQSSYRYNY